MRLTWPCLVALLLCTVPVTAQAPAGDPTEVVTDPPGDVAVTTGAPGQSLGSLDLVALDAATDETLLHLDLQVAQLGTQRLADSAMYFIDFAFGGLLYTVQVDRIVPLAAGPAVSASLHQTDPASGVRRQVEELEAREDGDAVAVAVPLHRLRTATGVPATDGALLEDLSVRSAKSELEVLVGDGGRPPDPFGLPTVEAPPMVYDRMPDDGVASYRLSLPVAEGAEVYFAAPDPFRASNGGPGTYVFPLRLVNQDDVAHDRVLRLGPLPEGWSHAFVADALHLEPGADVQTQLVVEAAGGHEHGGSTDFTVQASTPDGVAAGEVGLGIVYTDVPQPAGHHPRLTFHVLDQGSGAVDPAFETGFGIYNNLVVMNTLDDDPAASAQPATPSNHTWEVPLVPGLGIGLDFDLARTGLVHVALQSSSAQRAVPAVRLTGSLVLRNAAGDVELATLSASEPADIAGRTEVELALTPTTAAELVPYAPNQGLVLVLRSTDERTAVDQLLGGFDANLVGGWMTLPLLEYQDPVPAGTDRDIVATVTPPRQDGNPGDTLAFRIEVRNAGTRPLDLDVGVLSTAVPAHVLQDALHVGIGETMAVDLHVTVPAEATDGDQATAFVRLADGQVATLVGATVTVTTATDVASVDAPAAHGSPALGSVPILLALGVTAMALRRRR